MTKSKEQIIDSIDAFIEIRGSDYEEWYIGITDNPDRKLFDEHKVDKKCKNHIIESNKKFLKEAKRKRVN